MTDKTLQQAVLDELAWEPGVDAAHIGVTARVAGVRAIVENLEVRFSFDPDHGNDDIARRALLVLSWDVTIPDDRVKVKVEAGWVTLVGEVDWYYQKIAAAADVRKLRGVLGIDNEIVVKPNVHASDVHAKITAALGRNALIEANGIIVVADGGKVTLSGSVDTYYERRLAEDTAWSAPGVTEVEDNLTVV